MVRTTIMLPAELKASAERRARLRGTSLAELIREALEATLASAPAADPLFGDDAVFEGDTPRDLAHEHDRYLYDGET